LEIAGNTATGNCCSSWQEGQECSLHCCELTPRPAQQPLCFLKRNTLFSNIKDLILAASLDTAAVPTCGRST